MKFGNFSKSYFNYFKIETNFRKKVESSITYYLPDFSILRRGQIKSSHDPQSYNELSKVILGLERSFAPEVLFYPNLVGTHHMGLSDAIKQTCNGRLPYYCVGESLMQNIFCIGGTSKLPGFKERL